MGLFKDRVGHIVPNIPAGKVLDYTSVARLARSPGAPISVGPCMGPPGETCGWHRVVSNRGHLTSPQRKWQRKLLEDDRVKFTDSGEVDLSECLGIPLTRLPRVCTRAVQKPPSLRLFCSQRYNSPKNRNGSPTRDATSSPAVARV